MARRGRRGRKAKRKGSYTISVVAERFGVHPQTLRLYEREGLIEPARTSGNTRLYTDEDVAQLEIILSLTRELGVNLAGVEIILNMRKKMDAMQRQIREFVQFVNRSMTVADAAEDPLSNALIPLRTRMAPQRGQSEDQDRPPRSDVPEIVDV
ncbi:MAG: helix-turn-helix transcriptional regulator [Bryobacterales bacterium]|nr:helix-turn-helix transcriptional regulator [Bryobacterales bacterium]